MSASGPDMEVETVSIDDLRPYHRNPVDHSESVEHVMDSIRKFGFRVPVVVDDENTIIAGHGRFKAVQKLSGTLDERISELEDAGRETLAENLKVINEGDVFAMADTDLGSRDVSEFRITDNRITELSTWDDDLLKTELERLDGAVGFTEEELDLLLDDYDADIEVPDEEDAFELDVPDSGGMGVELVCPHCLERFEVSAEMIRMELGMVGDEELDEETEVEADA